MSVKKKCYLVNNVFGVNHCKLLMKELSAKTSSESMTIDSRQISVLTEDVLIQSASSHSNPGTILPKPSRSKYIQFHSSDA